MAFPSIDNIRVNAAKHTDDWYADEVVAGKEQPYTSVADACFKIPSAVRMKGRPVLITVDGLTEAFWWKDNLTDSGLIRRDQPLIDEIIARQEISGLVKQNYLSYNAFRGLALPKENGGIVAIGDSNLEGYVDNAVGVGEINWFTRLVRDIQSYQGPQSGIGFTNFADPTRYGFTTSGTTTIVNEGPNNRAIQLNVNAIIQFTEATNLVELWFNGSAGKLEFYYNDTLYRTVDCNLSGTTKNVNTFLNQNYPITVTPSVNSGVYKIKCIGAPVVITSLSKKTLGTSTFDTNYFSRFAVAGCTFGDFDPNDIVATTGLGGERNTLYLLNLGTNSIYSPDKATTAAVFGVALGNYIDILRSAKSNVVFMMPPRTKETSYPAVIEPYTNYLAVAIQVCKDKGIDLIDMNDVLAIGDPFGADGLHYSASGHLIIANFIINRLAKTDVQNTRKIYENTLATGGTLDSVTDKGATTDNSARFGLSLGVKGAANNNPGNGAFYAWENQENPASTAYRAIVAQLGLNGDYVLYQYNGTAYIETLRVSGTSIAYKGNDLQTKLEASLGTTKKTALITPTVGATSVTIPSLVNQFVNFVVKSGVVYLVGTTANEDDLTVSFNSATGAITFASPFLTGEKVWANYQGVAGGTGTGNIITVQNYTDIVLHSTWGGSAKTEYYVLTDNQNMGGKKGAYVYIPNFTATPAQIAINFND